MNIIDKNEIEFVEIWIATFTPDNPPLWQGVQSAMPKRYFFKTKSKLDDFIKKYDKCAYCINYTKSIAIKRGNYYHPIYDSVICEPEPETP